jgi:guanosine-3',5'-bis(diphosphate) 3'-pyrophosphohydrolase
VGAKVNGRMVPLRTKLRNGDIVEIVTQNRPHAEPRLAQLRQEPARAQQDQALAQREPAQRAIEIGRKLLEREARKFKVPMARLDDTDLARVAGEYGLATATDLMATIGFGKHSARQVLNKLAPGLITLLAERLPRQKTGRRKRDSEAAMSDAVKKLHLTGSDSLQVEGQNDLLVYRARCCNPIRGEEIIGYVTRGKGVAVHARSCPNVRTCFTRATGASMSSGPRRMRKSPAGQRNIRSRSPSTATTVPGC